MALLLLLISLDPPAHWHRYETADKKLAVSFPKKPSELSQKQNMSQGETVVTTITVQRTVYEESGYVLTWYDLKKPKTDQAEISQYLLGIEQGSINARQGRRLHTKSIKLGKHSGREFTWRIESGFVRTQIFLVKDRFVTVMFMAGDEQALTSQDAQLFFSSLKVNE